jgi:hypothetical protein
MALTKLGFIVVGSALDERTHRMVMASPSFELVVVGIGAPEDGPRVARSLVDDNGVQLIELCGGFGPLGAARVIEAIAARVPVGAVAYGAEALAGLQAIFGSGDAPRGA